MSKTESCTIRNRPDAQNPPPAPQPAQKSCGCKYHSVKNVEKKSDGCGCGGHDTKKSEKVDAGCGCGGHDTKDVKNAEKESGGCGCGQHHESENGQCACQGLLKYRRLHSACAMIFGIFLLEHIFATFLGINPDYFEQYIGRVHILLAGLHSLDKFMVYPPLIVVISCGIYLLLKSGVRYDIKRCKRGGKTRYFLQRCSAALLLVFILCHLTVIARHQAMDFSKSNASSSISDAKIVTNIKSVETEGFFAEAVREVCIFGRDNMIARSFAFLFFATGTLAAIYHFCNGFWSASVAWNIVTDATVQRRLTNVCLAIGIFLSLAAVSAAFAFTISDASLAVK